MQFFPKSRIVGGILIALSAVAVLARAARGEEITLHDGQKIHGTVVGFENGMFRIKTEFGFALVRKDKVKSISFSPEGAVEPNESKGSEASPAHSAARSSSNTAAPRPKPAAGAKPAPPAPPPKPVSRPLDVPLPTEIHGHLEGTTYVNDTFRFSFFKPPGWKVHAEAARETGHAIVAIGSENERTVLFVDRQVWSGEPNLASETTEANLRATYQDFHILDVTRTRLAGRPAVRREFRGLLDGAEWRGVSVRVADGSTVFGLIGLTSAETIEFYQALLDKIINSFHFLNANPETAANR